jgi:hypothetical protein
MTYYIIETDKHRIKLLAKFFHRFERIRVLPEPLKVRPRAACDAICVFFHLLS